MRDRSWFGFSPSSPYWSDDGKRIYFRWRREGDLGDSLYVIGTDGGIPRKVSLDEQRELPVPGGEFNSEKTLRTYEKNGDIFLLDIRSGNITQVTGTVEREEEPRFSFHGRKIVFELHSNLFSWDVQSGIIHQITNFQSGSAQKKETAKTELQRFLQRQEMQLITILGERKQRTDKAKEVQNYLAKQLRPFYYGTKKLSSFSISPDGDHVVCILSKPSEDTRHTIVPNYVTESGYTEDIPSRPKVGEPRSSEELCFYNVRQDTVRIAKNLHLLRPEDTSSTSPPVWFTGAKWSDDGKKAFVQIFSLDNKDRWIAALNLEQGELEKVLFRDHDSAWIGGPGWNAAGWMPDNKRVWYESEANGYAHLYVVGTDGGNNRQLTNGAFEVYDPRISRDKKKWYFSSNEVHPGERHLYSMPLEGGARSRLTALIGQHECLLSPDETMMADIYSYSNRPPELFLQKNRPEASAEQVTHSLTKEFLSHQWMDPEIITIPARDGKNVFARLYQPLPSVKNNAAVIFVHGAGYLQNADKGWSFYYHEYFFHNLLTQGGYTVLDMDYRASAGYGRDWRTAIYRHMGGKDLDDNVDGAKFLVQRYGIDAKRIGIYGGSYGGFITIMALFTSPGVFAAGAALRPVTDWAHYDQGYTADILNIPYEDSIAYRQSSPIYFAEGLQDALLICHGMVDVNVHYQDAVRLVQRLIELRKENWEFASYPVEDHGFKEETSWLDEYRRILKLFNSHLLKK